MNTLSNLQKKYLDKSLFQKKKDILIKYCDKFNHFNTDNQINIKRYNIFFNLYKINKFNYKLLYKFNYKFFYLLKYNKDSGVLFLYLNSSYYMFLILDNYEVENEKVDFNRYNLFIEKNLYTFFKYQVIKNTVEEIEPFKEHLNNHNVVKIYNNNYDYYDYYNCYDERYFLTSSGNGFGEHSYFIHFNNLIKISKNYSNVNKTKIYKKYIYINLSSTPKYYYDDLIYNSNLTKLYYINSNNYPVFNYSIYNYKLYVE